MQLTIKPSGSGILFFRNRAVEAVEVSEVSKAAEVNESAEVSEAWKIAAENFRVILVLEFNNLRTKIISF